MTSTYISSYYTCYDLSRRVVVSREARMKQQARAHSGQCNHYSELFTRMVGLNY